MVDASETAGCEANDVDGSLDTVSLNSGMSGGISAAAIDSLVAAIGYSLSVTLQGQKSQTANILQSNENIPPSRKLAEILDGVIAHWRTILTFSGISHTDRTPGCRFRWELRDALQKALNGKYTAKSSG
jgi:hypothetical protein